MYLVAIAWFYVALMMALAEATHPQGTVLGAVFTLLLYGIDRQRIDFAKSTSDLFDQISPSVLHDSTGHGQN